MVAPFFVRGMRDKKTSLDGKSRMAGTAKKKLSPKQERFVEEYLIDFNATRAAKAAGYSEKTAYSQGFEQLKKPEIQAKIADARARMSKRTEITQDKVLNELAKVGFANIWHFLKVNDSGEYVADLSGATEEQVAAISWASFDGPGRVTIRMHDKLAALDKIAKHLGMYEAGRGEDDDAVSLTVNINSRDPVGDVLVTRSSD